MAEFNTLLLDQDVWDLVLDANGNIAMAAPPYALAQDVASACRTFEGEVYYDTTQGIPYFEDVLGQLPPASLLSQLLSNQALTVPGTVTAQTIITAFNRISGEPMGYIVFTDENDQETTVSFG